MILLILSALCLFASMAFAAMGEIWGWFLWWVLAIGLGVVGGIKESTGGSDGND